MTERAPASWNARRSPSTPSAAVEGAQARLATRQHGPVEMAQIESGDLLGGDQPVFGASR
jgi:hypothetical protein